MRVVLDANVLVSAAIRTGPSHRIVQSWLEGGAFELVICPRLLTEVRDVLIRRPRLRRWISLETAELYLAALEVAADLVADPRDVPATTRDPDDDYLVALAREQSANYIVSGDHDLVDWDDQRPPVLPPADFAELIDS